MRIRGCPATVIGEQTPNVTVTASRGWKAGGTHRSESPDTSAETRAPDAENVLPMNATSS